MVDSVCRCVIVIMRVKGRKYQGDTGDCKSPAYSTPGSIPGRPTKFALVLGKHGEIRDAERRSRYQMPKGGSSPPRNAN